MITLNMVLTLLGGLGLFLYGMTLMSDSLQRVAGARMRDILAAITKNKYTGILVGTIFTGVIQSSSAVTVMVVSFVNAGLMDLYQAVGIIYGANIGTTITSQLVSFNLSQYAPVFLIIGVIVMMFVKNPTAKKIGEVIIGFGILFLGISTMSSAMASLREADIVRQIFSSLSNPFLGILIGFAITAVVQSSSVTVSILLLMAKQGLIGLPICLFIILGCNIGACASSMIASLSGNKDAKRAALIHLLFNIIGTVLMAVILLLGMGFVSGLIESVSGGDIGRCVANAHTIFKVFQVIVLMPFTGAIVKLTHFIVPGVDAGDEKHNLQYIGNHYILAPATAVPQGIKEMRRMGDMAIDNLNCALTALLKNDREEADQVFEVEKEINYLEDEITAYLVRANQLELPERDSSMLAALFHVVSDIERVGDHAENIAEDAKVKMAQGVEFSAEGTQEMQELLDMTLRILNLSMEMFTSHSSEHLEEILELENSIDIKERKLQASYVGRLTENKITPQAGMMFSDLASNLERIADHATNIAFSILEKNPEQAAS